MADEVHYETLTKLDKVNGLKQRLRSLEAEHYMKKIAYLGLDAPQEQDQQLNLLAKQINATQKALATLEADKGA